MYVMYIYPITSNNDNLTPKDEKRTRIVES